MEKSYKVRLDPLGPMCEGHGSDNTGAEKVSFGLATLKTKHSSGSLSSPSGSALLGGKRQECQSPSRESRKLGKGLLDAFPVRMGTGVQPRQQAALPAHT